MTSPVLMTDEPYSFARREVKGLESFSSTCPLGRVLRGRRFRFRRKAWGRRNGRCLDSRLRARPEPSLFEPVGDELLRCPSLGNGGEGDFGATEVAMSAGGTNIVETGIREAPDVAASIATEDDDDGLSGDARDGDPPESVDTGEEIRD